MQHLGIRFRADREPLVAELTARAEECRIPLGVVQTFDDVLSDEHLAARGFWEGIEIEAGTLKSPALPYRIDGEPRATWSEPGAANGDAVR